MAKLLIDTHILLWSVLEPHKLGKHTKTILQKALTNRQVVVSAITYWEIELLAQKGRITLGVTTDKFRQDMTSMGVLELPITGEIGILANQLSLHPDPADRLIVATAIINNTHLMTADQKILAWQHSKKPVIYSAYL